MCENLCHSLFRLQAERSIETKAVEHSKYSYLHVPRSQLGCLLPHTGIVHDKKLCYTDRQSARSGRKRRNSRDERKDEGDFLYPLRGLLL